MRLPVSGPVRLRHLLVPLCLPLVLLACGTDAPSEARPAKESNTRPSSTSDTGDDTAADPEFCAELAALADDRQPDIGDDPAAAVEALSAVGELAPGELRDDFETLASVVSDLAAIDESDPASIGEALTIVTRPDVVTASQHITTYAKEECGVDLESTTGDAETTTVPGGSDSSAAGDIDLEDIDAVKEANADAAWPDKTTSTTIINDTDVTLSAEDSALLTADEGLAACTAVREALLVINPQVTVTVKSGETVVAAAAAGSTCVPS